MAQKSVIRAVAKQLNKGNICYINRRTHAVITLLSLENAGEDIAARETLLADLEKNIKKYYKVPQMSSFEEIHVKKDFINEPINTSIRRELTKALRRENPNRNYMQIINNDEILQQYWRNFQFDWYEQWVKGYLLNTYKY